MQKPSKEKSAVIEEVVLKYHVELLNYVIRLVRATGLLGDARQVAEDIVQIVYANLLRYQLPAHFDAPIAYLKVIALREFLKYRDRQMKEQSWHEPLGDKVTETVADERFTESADFLEQRLVRRATALLPFEEQRVITMVAHGMKPKEITDALSISVSSVAKTLRTLRKLIQELQGRTRK